MRRTAPSMGRGHQRPQWASDWNPIQVRRIESIYDKLQARLTANATQSRFLWERSGLGSAGQVDPRRNLLDEFGWPALPTAEMYSRMAKFDSIGSRVVTFPARECWQVQPILTEVEEEQTVDDDGAKVGEDEADADEGALRDKGLDSHLPPGKDDPKSKPGQPNQRPAFAGNAEGVGEQKSPFLEDFKNVADNLRGDHNWFKPKENGKGNPIWSACAAADALSREGQYGILWMGLDDGADPWQPVEGLEDIGSIEVEFKKGEKKPQHVNPEKVAKMATNAKLAPRLVRNIAGTPTYDPKKPSMPNPEDLGDPEGEGKAKRKLLFLRPYPEVMATVTKWEGNIRSQRYMKPLEYLVKTIDPNGAYPAGFPINTQRVHWTRAIHIADTHHMPSANEDLAIPAMQPVYYDILDAQKISGADSEGFFRNAFLKIFFETHPSLGGDVLVDDDEIEEMMEQMLNGGQQHGRLSGMHANPVGPQVASPTEHLDSKYKRISIAMGYPKRVWEGSERGEMASGQDEDTHSDRVAERHNEYCSPHICAPLVNRFILVGLCRPPKLGYHLEWPAIGNQDEAGKATVFSTRATAFAAWAAIPPENKPMPDRWMLEHEAGYPPDEVEEMLAEVELEREEAKAEQEALMREQSEMAMDAGGEDQGDMPGLPGQKPPAPFGGPPKPGGGGFPPKKPFGGGGGFGGKMGGGKPNPFAK